MFEPHLEILPSAQRKLWKRLVEIPKHFVLYGGTALALRLGHRESVDFDLFSSRTFDSEELLTSLNVLRKAEVIQNSHQSLTVVLGREDRVKVSFFGGISTGRVGSPETTPDGVLSVASLLDLAGTKAKVILQRAEAKDYLDLLEIFKNGITLSQAMAAARALYGEQYNSMLTVKSLSYFGDGDLHKLTPLQKTRLTEIASEHQFDLPMVPIMSQDLSEA